MKNKGYIKTGRGDDIVYPAGNHRLALPHLGFLPYELTKDCERNRVEVAFVKEIEDCGACPHVTKLSSFSCGEPYERDGSCKCTLTNEYISAVGVGCTKCVEWYFPIPDSCPLIAEE